MYDTIKDFNRKDNILEIKYKSTKKKSGIK